MNSSIADRLTLYLKDGDDLADHADHRSPLQTLQQYFTEKTGGMFEAYGRNDPFSITADDLVAVTMLSMEIRLNTRSGISTRSALILEEKSPEISGLLREITSADNRDLDWNLEDCGADELHAVVLDDTSPVMRLVDLLSPVLSPDVSPSNKWVAISKLLARKRPGLLPVRDRTVQMRLKFGQQRTLHDHLAEWWTGWHDALHQDAGGSIRRDVKLLQDELVATTNLSIVPSLVRIADVLVWNRCTCKSTYDG